MTNDDEGEGGGVTIPPKNDDVIYSSFISSFGNLIVMSIISFVLLQRLLGLKRAVNLGVRGRGDVLGLAGQIIAR